MVQYRYEQVAQIIENKIKNGEWSVGQKIPGELQLSRDYQVGRSTIRETLNILQQKGIIEKRHGSGTYVIENKKKMENPLLSLNSIGTMIENAGYEPGSVFYGVSHEIPNAKLREKLNLDKNERVVIVNRERTADKEQVVFSYNVFPEKLIKNIFDEGLHGSIFQILKESCEIEVDYAITEIKGIDKKNKWDKEAINFLGEPIILLEQQHFDKNGVRVLFSFDYIRTDLVMLHIRREL